MTPDEKAIERLTQQAKAAAWRECCWWFAWRVNLNVILDAVEANPYATEEAQA